MRDTSGNVSDPWLSSPGLRETADPVLAAEMLIVDADSISVSEDYWDREAEVADRVAVAHGAQSMEDRIAAAIGCRLKIQAQGLRDQRVEGIVRDIGSGWVEISGDRGPTYLNVGAVNRVEGLTAAVREPDTQTATGKAYGWVQLLRKLGQSGRVLQFRLRDSSVLMGSIDRVGLDHFDVDTGTSKQCIATSAISTLSLR
jgi:hypothetical protein